MNYIILDMEWNQPFNSKLMVRKPIMLCGEIIQIGAVKLDENYHLVDTFKIMIMPQYYTKMHKCVSKITHIRTEDLQYGFPFETAFKHFKRWCGDEFAFLTWGPDDIDILRLNMKIHNIDDEWIPAAYNLQIIFDNQHTGINRQISLKDAMEIVGEPALKAHDALNDARNTACICSHMDIKRGMEEYEEIAKNFNKREDHTIDKCRNGKHYQSRGEALADESLLKFYCPECGAEALCIGFLRQNSEKYICIGECADGHNYFVRFKFTREGDGSFTVVRIIYEMDEDKANYYNFRKNPHNKGIDVCSESEAV